MTLKPNRPVRVGTAMTMTDANGEVPKASEPAPEVQFPSLSRMTKAELESQAEAEGVDLSGASNNDERRAAIEASRK